MVGQAKLGLQDVKSRQEPWCQRRTVDSGQQSKAPAPTLGVNIRSSSGAGRVG